MAATKAAERLSTQVEQHLRTQEIGASYSFPSGDTDSEPEVMVVVAKDPYMMIGAANDVMGLELN